MKVLVIGGGIGGLTAALALSRAGHAVTLAEKAAQFSPVGAGIILAPNAAQALASLGVDLAPHGRALSTMVVQTAAGTVLQRIEPERLATQYGPLWALSRPTLHEALVAALPGGVEVQLGTSVTDLDDATAKYELVVGADGLHSQVRVLLLGDAAHAMTPNQGQGAAMAIEDAIGLTRALAGGPRGLLERYVAARHQRVRTVQLDSRRLGAVAHWQHPLARGVRDGLLRLVPASAGDAQYRRLIEPGLALLQPAR